MRERLRTVWEVLAFSVRIDPWTQTVRSVCFIVSAVTVPATALFVGRIVDAVVTRDTHAGTVAAVLLVALTVARSSLALIGFILQLRGDETAGHAALKRVIRLLGSIPGTNHYERPDLADKVLRLQATRIELGRITDSVTLNIATALQAIATAAVLAQVSPWLFFLVAAGIPPVLAASHVAKASERLRDAQAQDTRRLAHYRRLAEDADAGGEVRLFGLDDELRARHEQLWAVADRDQTMLRLRSQAVQSAAWLAFTAAYLTAVGLVLRRAVHGDASAGDVALTAAVAAQIRTMVANAVASAQDLANRMAAIDRYAWLRDLAADATSKTPHGQPPTRITDGIRLNRVSFRYDGAETDVLRDLDIHLPAGSVVAIVGDNGAGKSTLVKLLARFHEPSTGSIDIDGTPLAGIDPTAWRQQISAGFQGFCRFELLLRETVGIGDVDRIDDPAAVATALGRAGAQSVVDVLPDGLDTQLGTRWRKGTDLSGGQWQKLGIARALMRDEPLLLLLDEPTAALDARAEHDLFERFATAARTTSGRGGITILVSHRFSTVRMADLILVVEDGRISEHGSHQELLQHGGTYAELYQLQARAYSKEG